ncbi:MAG TPA: acetate/propionate family kinase [Silvibacterium sp.]|nr:acetate/propionate family kinase [Silvibacterium sp.]
MSAILAINSGSSTLKFGLFAEDKGGESALATGAADGIGQAAGKLNILNGDGVSLHSEQTPIGSQQIALTRIIDTLKRLGFPEPIALGHRIVHGGPRLRDHVRITPDVIAALEASVHFAPVHIPTSLALIHHVEEIYPDLPQFACFDTVFHRTMPEKAYHYPLPAKYLEQGVQRYGFHGLSYASIVHQLGAELKPRTVVAHLGNGASLAALRDGKSVDTSMGLTPTGGIPMSTRTGDLDPGVLLYIRRTEGLSGDELENLLNHESGLEAIGGSSDMRELQKAAANGDSAAALAIDIFCTGIAKFVAAFAVSLGGIEMLVFAGGIGEHSAQVRAGVCERLPMLGVELDPARNAASDPVLSSDASRVAVRIVPAQEEIQMAREVRARL